MKLVRGGWRTKESEEAVAASPPVTAGLGGPKLKRGDAGATASREGLSAETAPLDAEGWAEMVFESTW
jgi:hypothetical protein